jgi:arylsulfatase A-like enzyme/tetratricopeptide (TPR) repeat protein
VGKWRFVTAAAVILAVALAVGIALWRVGLPGSERAAAPPNVLLITIDTLRWDRLGCYGGRAETTPVLDRLAARGVRLETAIMHAPLTAPSHASILTGLTPLRHGVRDNGSFVLPRGLPTLGSVLGGAGYATAAFVSGYPLDRRYGLASGFGLYDDALPRGRGGRGLAYVERRADDTTSRVVAWLNAERERSSRPDTSRRRQPWFVWLHYFDPHAPYEPPGEFASRFAGRLYDGEVAFVDAQIGRLLNDLEQSGELARTLVVVTADHGESLGEHGEETHGVFIYDATLRVPFIVAGPGVAAGRLASAVARGIDVLPTIADFAGAKAPEGIDGRSLRASIDGRSMTDEPVYIESVLTQRHLGWAPLLGLRTQDWKFVDAPRRELYDLAADHGETRNVADEHADRVTSMAGQLAAQMRVRTNAPAAAPDRDAAERLRALGYLGGGTAGPPVAASHRDPKDGVQLISRLEHGIADARVDPDRAIGALEGVLAQDPGIALARRYLAVALAERGDHRRAAVELQRLRSEGAATAEDLVLLSESLRVTGRRDEAGAILGEAARRDPGSPDPALTEARALMAQQKPVEASEAFRRALAISPGHPEAMAGLGEAALLQGDLESAAALFEQAIARDPSDPAPRLRLAVVRARQGQMQLALPLFQQVVEAAPQNAEALAGLGAALARSGRMGEAVPYFERALAAGLRTPAVYNGLGFARLESGDHAGALTALRASLALRPDQPQVARVARELSAGRVPQR